VDEAATEGGVAAATETARNAGLSVDRAVVVHNSNKLALRLTPCDVFARVAVAGQEVAALEVGLALALAASDAPVARLDPRVEARVHHAGGFAVTFWTFYETIGPGGVSAPEYADGLRRLHLSMQRIAVATPHFTDRVAEAQELVDNRDRSPRLADSDRDFLRATLRDAWQAIQDRGAPEQLLHGEPHRGNVLRTSNGLRFIDLETSCRGPIEFDVAHTPHDVASCYEAADQELLGECRRLVLAMVAAWRCDARDEFPSGHEWGRVLVRALRGGEPWPTLDALEGV
jgi:hypothetical protein